MFNFILKEMDYKVKEVPGDHTNIVGCGYRLYEDELYYYSAVCNNGVIDNSTWARLNAFNERDMPIFTREYCDYEGIERSSFDTITVIE